MNAYRETPQTAFAQPEPMPWPTEEIDVDRLVWDREYRDEIQGQLKNGNRRLR